MYTAGRVLLLMLGAPSPLLGLEGELGGPLKGEHIAPYSQQVLVLKRDWVWV